MTFRRCLGLLTLTMALGSACALTPMMPPLDRSYLQSSPAAGPPPSPRPPTPAPATESAPGAEPAPSRPASGSRAYISFEYESTDDVTRASVMTHGGSYFLWVQKPQLTFFYVYPGQVLTEAPPVVYLVMRTQSPQGFRGNRLLLTCNGTTSAVPGLPTSRLAPGIQTSSHFLTFTLPTETFLQFSACQLAAVEVGGVRAPFNTTQALQLQILAAELQGPPRQSSDGR